MQDISDIGERAPRDAGDGVWLTYEELGKARGISTRAAVRMTQRQRLRRQPGNDGKVRVLVPRDMLAASHRASQVTAQGTSRRDRAGDAQDDVRAAIEALRGENAALKGQVATLEKAIGSERARADALKEWAATANRAANEQSSKIAELRAGLDQANAEAQEARQEAEALRQADNARKARGRWARLRAAWRRE